MISNMAVARDQETIRVALIGTRGCGKSALGNILLGRAHFQSKPKGDIFTTTCEVGSGSLPSGQKITIVDTPGIFDINKQDITTEFTKYFGYLSPGPHAFIIVLDPNSAKDDTHRLLTEFISVFGDKTFLKYTFIVMVRKFEIKDASSASIDIHDFIINFAGEDIKSIYRQCGERIVAVENLAPARDKIRYAQEVADVISVMDGYYDHNYLLLRQQRNLQEDRIRKLKEDFIKAESEHMRSNCSIT